MHRKTRQKFYEHTITQIHVQYLGEYVFMSIMLELASLNRRERGGRRELDSGVDTLGS
jgi:hypothetical protein